jgi:hypothetical protein
MVLEVRLTPETLIDRTEERKVFRSMFTPGSMLRIMKVAVPSGGGKSGLLKVFRDYCVLGTVTARAVLVDFADNRGNEALTPLDVARRIQSELTRYSRSAFDRFATFDAAFRVEQREFFWPNQPLTIHSTNEVSHLANTQYIGTQILPNKKTPFEPNERLEAQRECLSAFVDDLTALLDSTDVLLIFDTWEKCPTEVQDWIRQTFVCDLIAANGQGPAASRLRLVLAGRPRAEVAGGFEVGERLDWGLMDPAGYTAAVSELDRLSSFEDDEVRLFLSLYGIDEGHARFAEIRLSIKLLTDLGNLQLAYLVASDVRAKGVA